MQSASTSRPPQQNDEHLSPVAAKMFLAALPGRIQRALLAHAQETQYPLEMVLEMPNLLCFVGRKMEQLFRLIFSGIQVEEATRNSVIQACTLISKK